MDRMTAPAPELPALFTSHAQNFEDVMLWRALHDVHQGCYIDVGAGEPDADSVTQAFYERGWTGVNVEPLQGPFNRLRQARPKDINLNVALGAAPGESALYVVGHESGLSTLDPILAGQHRAVGWDVEESHVQIRTLAQICAEHITTDLHFLKIDAEGSELDILRGADFTRWRPWIVLLESVDPVKREPQHKAWETEVLQPADYTCVWFDGLNRFYLATEHAARLRKVFQAPPNVFDNFVRVSEIRLADQLQAARNELDASEGRLRTTQERVDQAQARVHAAQTLTAQEQARVAAAEARADDAQGQVHAAHDHVNQLQLLVAELQKRISATEGDLQQAAASRDQALASRDQAVADARCKEQDITGLRESVKLAIDERNGWMQELFEANRFNAELTTVRQRLLEDLARVGLNEGLRTQDHARDLAAIVAERDKAVAAAAYSELWLEAVKRSRSWRVTRPVRVLGRLLGRGSRI